MLKSAGRVFLALLMGLALLVGRPFGVSAHAELVSSNPVDGSTVEGPITSIFLTFGEGVKHLNDLSIKDQSGHTYKVKSIDYAGKNVTLNLAQTMNNGKFALNWQALSVDGHLAPGALSFSVGKSPTKASTATHNEPKAKGTHQAHSQPVITYSLGVLLVIIIIGFFALLRRKKA